MKVSKVNKLIANVYDKNYYSIPIFALKHALKHDLIVNNIHSVISFRHGAWLKPYIELRMNAKRYFEKEYLKFKNNAAYGKSMENIRKHRDNRLVTNDKKRSIFSFEPNYHATKHISKDLLIMEMKKRELYINKPIYLDQAILDISKILMHEVWYDYIKPMFGDNAKLCYMDTDSFVMMIKTDDFFKDINSNIEKRFDTSNFDKNDNRSLLIGKN